LNVLGPDFKNILEICRYICEFSLEEKNYILIVFSFLIGFCSKSGRYWERYFGYDGEAGKAGTIGEKENTLR